MRPALPLSICCLLACASLTAQDWPCWRGPHGTAHVPYEGKLVDSLAKAKLVWRSEHEILQTYPEGLKFQKSVQSGQCGPIVYDGLVYQYYYEPNGEWYGKERVDLLMADRAKTMGKQQWAKDLSDEELRKELEKKFALLADDVLYCVDAKTGKTVFKQVWSLQGVSHAWQGRGTGFIAAKTGPHARPCAGEGKVFVLGSSARLYACDAKTGEEVWAIELPGHKGLMEKVEAAKPQGYINMDRYFCGSNPTYVDGLVVVGMGSDVYAYDAKTGERKWRVERVGGRASSPVVWSDGDKNYIITGRPAMIEPQSGQVVWQWEGGEGVPALNPDYLTVGDGHIVVLSQDKLQRTFKTGKGSMEGCGAVGFRFSAKGVEHAWTQPDASMSHHIRPVIAHGHLWARNSGANAKDFFYVLDLSDGTMVAKSQLTGVGGRTSGSMIMVGDRILMDRADIIIADPKKFVVPEPPEGWYIQKIPGHEQLLHANSVAMAFAGGFLYIRCQDRLACLDMRAH